MKKILKSFISFLAVLCLISSVSVISFAKTVPTVYSESFTATAGEDVDVPVYIKNNTGIMGFKIIISYDRSVFTPIEVVKGTVLKSGMFNDSIGTSKNNEFSVLWCSSSDVNDNGTLFTLHFNTDSKAKGKHTITIKYSQDDTFNEHWQDVSLNCENASVDFGGEEPIPAPTFWDKIVRFFRTIIDFIVNLF